MDPNQVKWARLKDRKKLYLKTTTTPWLGFNLRVDWIESLLFLAITVICFISIYQWLTGVSCFQFIPGWTKYDRSLAAEESFKPMLLNRKFRIQSLSSLELPKS